MRASFLVVHSVAKLLTLSFSRWKTSLWSVVKLGFTTAPAVKRQVDDHWTCIKFRVVLKRSLPQPSAPLVLIPVTLNENYKSRSGRFEKAFPRLTLREGGRGEENIGFMRLTWLLRDSKSFLQISWEGRKQYHGFTITVMQKKTQSIVGKSDQKYLYAKINVYSASHFRAELCWIIWHRATCILLLPRDCRRIHKLREKRLLKSCKGLQKRHRRKEYSLAKLGHLSQSEIKLFDSRRVSLLLQRNSWVFNALFLLARAENRDKRLIRLFRH